jgi:HEAT repeat protein
MAALNHPDANVRHNAAFSLWQIDGRTNIITILADRLSSDANFGRLDWLNAKSVRLGDINRMAVIGPGAQSAIPVLIKMLKGEDEDLREAARDALKKIQIPNKPQEWF